MIESVDDEGDVSFYSYFDTSRVRKDENGAITRYFFAEYEEEEDVSTGQITELKYYFANHQRLARDSSVDGLAYYHQDHLGSSTRMTDAAGTVIRTMGYQPYGTDSYSTGSASVKYKFTGQEKDNTGLYYYGARFYDPELGRFLQADTIIPYPDDPQSYNRYSYVRNNPIKYIDPSGNIFGLALNSLFINQAAVGAAFGAAFSAVTGGDVLEGALNGAIDGYFKSLFGPTFGGGIAGFVDSQLNGGNAGQAALSGYISGAIEGLAAAVGFGVGSLSLEPWVGDLVGLGISGFSGSLSGGVSAEITGGDFWDGPANGAIAGVASWAVLVEIPSSIANLPVFTDSTRFHLPLYPAIELVFEVGTTFYHIGGATVGAVPWTTVAWDIAGFFNPAPLGNGTATRIAVKKLSGRFKGGTRLRKNLGNPPSHLQKPQAHHDLPQNFRRQFEDAGLNIEDGNFGRWVEGGPVGNHQKWSREFNKEWERFFQQNQNANKEKIIEQMNRLRTDPRFQ